MSIQEEFSQDSWEALNLNKEISSVLQQSGFEQPTEIQKQSLKYLYEKFDLIISSHTGSGKTLCYLLPIINYILNNHEKLNKNIKYAQALIIVPTRELAQQILKVLETIKQGLQNPELIRPLYIIGGLCVEKQERQLKKSPNIIIATPGRLWDLMTNFNSQYLKYLSYIKYLVIDEIDRLIELGLFKEISQIFKKINLKEIDRAQDELEQEEEFVEFNNKKIKVDNISSTQKSGLNEQELSQARHHLKNWVTLITSATITKMSGTSRMYQNNQFKKILKKQKEKEKTKRVDNPKMVDILTKVDFQNEVKMITLKEHESSLPKNLSIYWINSPNENKIFYLDFLIRNQLQGLSIVFVNSIETAKSLTSLLHFLSHNVVNIHSHMKQMQRFKKIEKFRENSGNCVLITTDVSSRGIDIPNVDNVIHYHLPKDLDTFVHWSGRTARNQKEGTVYILSSAEDSQRLGKYQNEIRNIQFVKYQPSEIFKHQEQIQQAKMLEKQQFELLRKQQQVNWKKKMLKNMSLENSDEEEFELEEQKKINSQKKILKVQKKQYNNQVEQKAQKKMKYSTFIDSEEIQNISNMIFK